MHDQVVSVLNNKVPGANAEVLKREVGDAVVFVNPDHIVKVCEVLKSEPEFDFTMLQVITGTDYLAIEAKDDKPAQEARIEVSYILTSLTKKHDLILKVKLPRENPEIDTVVPVWRAANFQERECYDMLGVTFRNHPDHRRILCPDDWEGYPLRRDYEVQKVYRGMDVNPEAKMNIADRTFGGKEL